MNTAKLEIKMELEKLYNKDDDRDIKDNLRMNRIELLSQLKVLNRKLDSMLKTKSEGELDNVRR